MEESKKESVQTQNQQVQKDSTPKWKIRLLTLFAIGSCSAAIASIVGLFGDAPGQCIKNNSYTKNYKKRLEADFADMVRRKQYHLQLKNNG